MKASISALVVILAPMSARADDAGSAAYKAMLSFTKVTRIEPVECVVEGEADFEGFKPHLDVIREAWLNRDFSIDFYQQRWKQVFLFLAVKRFAEVVTEGLYRYPGPDRCSFSIRVKYDDKFGQPRSLVGATWRFTREQANKVNWANFDPRDFLAVALDYKLGPEVADWTSDEPSFAFPPSDPQATCDEKFVRANAIFTRATSFCSKDYMDTKAGYFALAKAKICAAKMTEAGLKSAILKSMMELDRVAKARGKKGACQFVESVERDVMAAMK